MAFQEDDSITVGDNMKKGATALGSFAIVPQAAQRRLHWYCQIIDRFAKDCLHTDRLP